MQLPAWKHGPGRAGEGDRCAVLSCWREVRELACVVVRLQRVRETARVVARRNAVEAQVEAVFAHAVSLACFVVDGRQRASM